MTKMCVLVYTDKTLQNADADTGAVGIFLRNTLTSGTAQLYESLEEETTHQQSERSSGRLSGADGS